jgi:hypothetical protein
MRPNTYALLGLYALSTCEIASVCVLSRCDSVPGGVGHRPAVPVYRVLGGGLLEGLGDVVVGSTERLPVAPVPEQLLVTPVGDDVVHHRGGSNVPSIGTHTAEGILSKEDLPSSIPPSSISASPRGGSLVLAESVDVSGDHLGA